MLWGWASGTSSPAYVLRLESGMEEARWGWQSPPPYHHVYLLLRSVMPRLVCAIPKAGAADYAVRTGQRLGLPGRHGAEYRYFLPRRYRFLRLELT